MRTRKTFTHEDGIYEGVSRLPEPNENLPKEIVTLDNPYDCYPEKQSTTKTESENFEESVDFQLGKEYKLHLKTDNYCKSYIQDSSGGYPL